ncbi:hypothetical protein BpHYR1_051938, partial [Brachionus plicatilis]
HLNIDLLITKLIIILVSIPLVIIRESQVLQNLYIGGTEDVPAATICRICFGPSELKLWQFLNSIDILSLRAKRLKTDEIK